MNSNMIKEFLVGLGFEVDTSSLSKFNQAIATASKRVGALYLSIKVLSAGIFASMAQISEGFEQMGYEYRIIAPAINKTLVLRNELLKAYRIAGVDIVQTIQQSIKFNMAMSKLQFTFKALSASVASKFFPLLTKNMDIFRKQINANMPKITASLQKFITFIFKAFEATTILGARVFSILQRVYDFFYMLHKQTDGWSTIILGVVAAWKFLNLAFLATPLGMLLTGLTALLALYDDFQVWREGGKSLFDWSSVIPLIDNLVDTLTGLWGVLKGILGTVFGIGKAIILAFSGNFKGALEAWGQAGQSLITIFTHLWETIKGLLSSAGSIAGLIGQFFGGDKPQATNDQWQKWGRTGESAPLGAQQSSVSNTNQNVKQQTNINIMGSADAQATGAAVATQQNRVNFDMVRNMKGAVR